MVQEAPLFRFVPPPDPNIGRCIDGHILQLVIGRGGMGAAYLAAHQALSHSKCVIKLVLAEIARFPQAIVRIQLEAEALSRLKHDHIVRLQNFGVLDDGQFYLRFDFIEGKTLDRYVVDQGGSLPLRKAASLVFQVCNAIDFAHSLGIIHRDLKPDNLMVEFNPPGSHLKERIKVLDFGIAKVAAGAADPTGSGMTLGTARFMAPEQVTNAAAVSGAADVFSLGQLLYLLLTGKMPWGIPESDIAIYHKQRTEAPDWPPEELVSPTVAGVIMRCLWLNPEDRPTMRELAIELACAIPAEDGLESGTQILTRVVPDWVASSPHDATTLLRLAVADPIATPNRRPAADEVVFEGRERAFSASEVGARAVTATARPRARGAALASAASATTGSSPVTSLHVRPPESPPAALGDSTVQSAWTPPPTPLIAALPTGLISQRFDAQQPPPEARDSSLVVTSEIELATGTPAGPRPYEHAELPAVMVSNTHLAGVMLPPRAQGVSFAGQPEYPPVLVLPAASRFTSRRGLIAVLAVGLLLITIATFVNVRSSSRASAIRAINAAPATDAGVVTPEPPHIAAVSPDHVDAGQLSLGIDAGASVQLSPTQSKSNAIAPMPETGRRTRNIVPADPQRTPSTPDTAPFGEPKSAPHSQPSAIKKGELAIEVDTWAIIWLDGKQDEAPYRVKLPAGRYRLRMQHDDKDETMTVVVRPDEITIIKRNW